MKSKDFARNAIIAQALSGMLLAVTGAPAAIGDSVVVSADRMIDVQTGRIIDLR